MEMEAVNADQKIPLELCYWNEHFFSSNFVAGTGTTLNSEFGDEIDFRPQPLINSMAAVIPCSKLKSLLQGREEQPEVKKITHIIEQYNEKCSKDLLTIIEPFSCSRKVADLSRLKDILSHPNFTEIEVERLIDHWIVDSVYPDVNLNPIWTPIIGGEKLDFDQFNAVRCLFTSGAISTMLHPPECPHDDDQNRYQYIKYCSFVVSSLFAKVDGARLIYFISQKDYHPVYDYQSGYIPIAQLARLRNDAGYYFHQPPSRIALIAHAVQMRTYHVHAIPEYQIIVEKTDNKGVWHANAFNSIEFYLLSWIAVKMRAIVMDGFLVSKSLFDIPFEVMLPDNPIKLKNNPKILEILIGFMWYIALTLKMPFVKPKESKYIDRNFIYNCLDENPKFKDVCIFYYEAMRSRTLHCSESVARKYMAAYGAKGEPICFPFLKVHVTCSIMPSDFFKPTNLISYLNTSFSSSEIWNKDAADYFVRGPEDRHAYLSDTLMEPCVIKNVLNGLLQQLNFMRSRASLSVDFHQVELVLRPKRVLENNPSHPMLYIYDYGDITSERVDHILRIRATMLIRCIYNGPCIWILTGLDSDIVIETTRWRMLIASFYYKNVSFIDNNQFVAPLTFKNRRLEFSPDVSYVQETIVAKDEATRKKSSKTQIPSTFVIPPSWEKREMEYQARLCNQKAFKMGKQYIYDQQEYIKKKNLKRMGDKSSDMTICPDSVILNSLDSFKMNQHKLQYKSDKEEKGYHGDNECFGNDKLLKERKWESEQPNSPNWFRPSNTASSTKQNHKYKSRRK